MADWRKILTRTTHGGEVAFDALKYALARRFGAEAPLRIVPYDGWGGVDGDGHRRLHLRGRVLRAGPPPDADRDGLWRNLVATYERFESDEVPGARLVASFEGEERATTADREGFFDVVFAPSRPLIGERAWYEVDLELQWPRDDAGPTRATGRVLVPPAGAEVAVVSDVDDTVVQTHATDLLKMARATFLGSARTRLPFHGVAALYRALVAGPTGRGHNPIFYVSSSPWNLYGLLTEFFDLEGVPRGPFFLRDWGLDGGGFDPLGGHHGHKLEHIERLLAFYADLRFVLIGDSGQQDPEIYRELAHRHPERIRAIYIRDVTDAAGRREAIRALAEAVATKDIDLVLAPDSAAIAEHAATSGLLHPDALAEIAVERARDESPAEAEEALLDPETDELVVGPEAGPGAAGAAAEAGGEGRTVVVEGEDAGDRRR